MDNTKISDEAKGGGVSHDAGTGGSAMKTKQEKSPRIGRMRPIGDFFITSGTIAVCDSYASGDGVKWVRDALNSEWLGSVKVRR